MTVALLLLILLKIKNQLIIMSKPFDLNTTNLSHLSFLKKKKKIISPFTFRIRIFVHVKVKCDGTNHL